jgi:multiple sugar transport system substrate-binding protein
VAAAALAALTIVTVGAPQSALAQTTLTIDFPSWQATEPGTSDWWKALIAEFERRNPGIRVQFTHEPFTDYTRKMITRFAANNPPDIFHTPASDLLTFAREGWLEPLDSRLGQTDIPQTWNPLQSDLTYQGRTYGVLVLGYGMVLGYNEKMFQDAGITRVPTTSSELLDVARRLTRDTTGDGVVNQFGYAFPTVKHPGVYSDVTMFIFEAGGHWLTEQGQLNRASITAGWQRMREFVQARVVPMGLDNNGKRQFFIEGKAAMMVEGPWIKGFMDSAPEGVREHLRVAPMPFSGAVYGGVSNALAIPARLDARKKEIAWEFIKLFSSPEWQQKYATIAGQPPSRAGVVDESVLRVNPLMETFAAEAQKAISYFPPGMQERFTEFRDLAIDSSLAVVVQGQAIDRALADLERGLARLR